MSDAPFRAVYTHEQQRAPRTRNGWNNRLHLECGHIITQKASAGLPGKARCHWCRPCNQGVPEDSWWDKKKLLANGACAYVCLHPWCLRIKSGDSAAKEQQ